MSQSRLEKYVEILKALAINGSLKNSQIASQTKTDTKEAKRHLSFLVEKGLVEAKAINQKPLYSVTRRGITVLIHFNELEVEALAVEQIKNL
ncbi:MAG: winged helix-turn-helix domain-containing protein [Candidatus Bathyarchaeia archaeon]